MANQLHELGYRHMAAASLKPKHVERLVERWQAGGLAVGTLKNRMVELRWWAEKIGKQNKGLWMIFTPEFAQALRLAMVFVA